VKAVAIAGCFSCRKNEIVKIQALATLKDWTQKINEALAVERNGVSLNWQESVG
jgi:16S rRNA U1498 N3-methylase RsmE